MVTDEEPGESSQSSDKLAGELIAKHYEIIEEVGSGNVSIVYRARHLLINKIVAIKMLHKHNLRKPNTVMRFQREAKIVSVLDHPNVIKFYEFGVHSTEQPYLILEYVEGRTLTEVVAQGGLLEPLNACRLMLQILDGIEHLHSNDILHRDVKPDNIMLTGKNVIKLVDFGFAGRQKRDDQEQSLTRAGSIFGTPNYMSPEQQLGNHLDPRTDIYSLTALLYFLLSGKPPFQAPTTMTTLLQHANEAPPSVVSTVGDTDLAEQLDRLIAWGLAKDPDNRIPSIDRYRQELKAILGDVDGPHGTTSDALSKPVAPAARLSGVVAYSVAAGLIGLVVIGAFVLGSRHNSAETGKVSQSAATGDDAEETREQKIERWKSLDLKGQTLFNTGQYKQSEKTFLKSLTLARSIEPEGTLVKGTLEQLIDLNTVQNKPADDALAAELKRIDSLEVNLKRKEAQGLMLAINKAAASTKPVTKADVKDIHQVVYLAINCSNSLISLQDTKTGMALLKCLSRLSKRFPKEAQKWQATVAYVESTQDSVSSGVNLRAVAAASLKGIEKELELAKKTPNVDNMYFAEKYREAAALSRQVMDFPKALKYQHEATQMARVVFGPESVTTGRSLVEEAWLFADTGQIDRAKQMALQALKIYSGPGAAAEGDMSYLNQLADIYAFLGNFEMAAHTLSESLDVQQKAQMKNFFAISDCLIQIAHVGIKRRSTAGLAPLLKRAMAIRKRLRPQIASVECKPLRMLGDIAILEGRITEAEALYKKALAMDLADKRESNRLSAAEDYAALAKLYSLYGTASGDDQSVEALRAQIAIIEQAYGTAALPAVPQRIRMATILAKNSRFAEANECLIEAEEALNKHKDRMDPRSVSSLFAQRAQILEQLGKTAEASKYRSRAAAL
jgi:serine/threonine protein kinase